ncbi:MAG: hypothetical protein ABF830_11195, partial [Liquorilactobacillus satsumensis]
VRSENSDQIFMVVSFFSGFSITLTLSIVVSIAVWKFSSQLKNVIWIVLSILSSKELVLWFDKIFYSKLINDHVLLTTIFFSNNFNYHLTDTRRSSNSNFNFYS